jgi:hypothetical protein
MILVCCSVIIEEDDASNLLSVYRLVLRRRYILVRSALFKQRTGGLVVRWVTTSEYPLLYVFAILLLEFVGCTNPFPIKPSLFFACDSSTLLRSAVLSCVDVSKASAANLL